MRGRGWGGGGGREYLQLDYRVATYCIQKSHYTWDTTLYNIHIRTMYNLAIISLYTCTCVQCSCLYMQYTMHMYTYTVQIWYNTCKYVYKYMHIGSGLCVRRSKMYIANSNGVEEISITCNWERYMYLYKFDMSTPRQGGMIVPLPPKNN